MSRYHSREDLEAEYSRPEYHEDSCWCLSCRPASDDELTTRRDCSMEDDCRCEDCVGPNPPPRRALTIADLGDLDDPTEGDPK